MVSVPENDDAMQMASPRFGVVSCTIALLVVLVFCYLVIDLPLAHLFRLDHDTALYLVARFLTKFGDATYFLVPAMIVGAGCWRKLPRTSNRAWYIFWCVSTSGIAVVLLKMLFGRARPGQYFREADFGFHFLQTDAHYLSFPSGHATVFFAGIMSFAFLCPRWRVSLFVVASILSFTRVVTGVHYLSDVIAGAALALVCCYVLYQRQKESLLPAE